MLVFCFCFCFNNIQRFWKLHPRWRHPNVKLQYKLQFLFLLLNDTIDEGELCEWSLCEGSFHLENNIKVEFPFLGALHETCGRLSHLGMLDFLWRKEIQRKEKNWSLPQRSCSTWHKYSRHHSSTSRQDNILFYSNYNITLICDGVFNCKRYCIVHSPPSCTWHLHVPSLAVLFVNPYPVSPTKQEISVVHFTGNTWFLRNSRCGCDNFIKYGTNLWSKAF